MSRLVNFVVMSVSFATSRPISWGPVDRPSPRPLVYNGALVILGSLRLYGALYRIGSGGL